MKISTANKRCKGLKQPAFKRCVKERMAGKAMPKGQTYNINNEQVARVYRVKPARKPRAAAKAQAGRCPPNKLMVSACVKKSDLLRLGKANKACAGTKKNPVNRSAFLACVSQRAKK